VLPGESLAKYTGPAGEETSETHESALQTDEQDTGYDAAGEEP
jgi:hypothetical protein